MPIKYTKEEKERARKAQNSRRNEWIKENRDTIRVTMPKGTKERIQELGYSVNGFINEAVRVMLEANEQG